MRISGVTENQFHSIVARVSQSYGGNLIVHPDAHAYGKSGCIARVTVTDSHGPGTRVTWQGRHGPYTCWHGYRDVLALLFTEHPRAIIRTGLAIYRGAAGFLANYPETENKNIGSQIQPAYMPELCDCDSYSDGPWVEALEAAGPHDELPPGRYRAPRNNVYSAYDAAINYIRSMLEPSVDNGAGGRTYAGSLETSPQDTSAYESGRMGPPDTDALLAEISSLVDGDPWTPLHP